MKTSARSLRLATWNIGGGILGQSHQIAAIPELTYHASIIRESGADLVALQEAHEYTDCPGQVQQLAEQCGFPFFCYRAISRSHLDKTANLSLGIMSRFPIAKTRYVQFPNPNVKAKGPNGEDWVLFDKGVLSAEVDVDGRRLPVLNAHCFPLHYFGIAVDDPRAEGSFTILRQALMGQANEGFSCAAVDLNSPDIVRILGPEALKFYREGFTPQQTTPKGVQQDFLLVGTKLPIAASSVSETRADHSFCTVDIELL